MSDINYLPRNYIKSFRRAAAATDAVRNLMLLLHPGYTTLYTNFLGDALPGEWASAKTNGTSAAVTVATSQLINTTGTDDDGYAGQGFGLLWKGDNGVYMESAQSLDTITTSKIEMGLTDATDDAGAVNTKATPSATATDFCVLVRDTDDNTQLDVISQNTTGVAAAKENVYTVVGGTIFRTEFVAQNDLVAVFVNGANVAADAPMQGGTLVTPWWFAQARTSSASRVLSVEYVFCTGPNGLAIP